MLMNEPSLNQPTVFGDYRRRIGRLSLVVLVVFMISGALSLGFGMEFQHLFATAWGLGLTFSYLAITAICLGLMDLHPIKRIVLFAILPTIIFGACALAGFWLAMLGGVGFGFDFGIAARTVFVIAFLCLSMAWLFWFYRIYRGWMLTQYPSGQQPTNSALTCQGIARVSWITETATLLICLGVGISLCFVSRVFGSGSGIFLLFPVGSLFALFWLLPKTYYSMRTRFPVSVWAGLTFGVPIVVSLLVGAARFCDPAGYFSRVRNSNNFSDGPENAGLSIGSIPTLAAKNQTSTSSAASAG